MSDAMTELFGEPISVYTRAQALEDGVLVNEFELDGKTVSVEHLAREAGIRLPVALTAGLFEDVCKIPPRFQGWQDVTGRLWDVIYMSRRQMNAVVVHMLKNRLVTFTQRYQLIMHVGRKTYYTVKMVVSPGDDGQPCVTLMRDGED